MTGVYTVRCGLLLLLLRGEQRGLKANFCPCAWAGFFSSRMFWPDWLWRVRVRESADDDMVIGAAGRRCVLGFMSSTSAVAVEAFD